MPATDLVASLSAPELLTRILAWHFGQLHGYESLLALLLAFGPFVILAVVIFLRRRDDDDEDEVSAPRH